MKRLILYQIKLYISSIRLKFPFGTKGWQAKPDGVVVSTGSTTRNHTTPASRVLLSRGEFNNYILDKLLFKIALLLIFTFISSRAYSELHVDVDYSIFHYSNDSNVVELYYSYPESSYTMDFSDGIYRGSLLFNFTVQKETSTLLDSSWSAPYSYEKFTEDSQVFYGLSRFVLPSGKYKFRFTVVDSNSSSRVFRTSGSFTAPVSPDSSFFISGLQLANKIADSSDSSPHPLLFYKNGYYVYPNPLREISSSTPILYLYSEILGASRFSHSGVHLRYLIHDSREHLQYELEKSLSSITDNIIDAVSIPLDSLSSGVYYISLRVYNSARTDSTSSRLKFFLINRNITISTSRFYTEDEMFEMSEFSTYDEAKALDEYSKFSIIATPLEKRSWEKLSDLKARQRFLYRFWFVRNPDQKNPYNIELHKFRDRVKHSNIYFSYGGKTNGWSSDRGKVYIRYGEPVERNRHSATMEKRAYETWHYTGIDGGGDFYFVDRYGMGDYRLLHSTANDYIKNYNWESELIRFTNTNMNGY